MTEEIHNDLDDYNDWMTDWTSPGAKKRIDELQAKYEQVQQQVQQQAQHQVEQAQKTAVLKLIAKGMTNDFIKDVYSDISDEELETLRKSFN